MSMFIFLVELLLLLEKLVININTVPRYNKKQRRKRPVYTNYTYRRTISRKTNENPRQEIFLSHPSPLNNPTDIPHLVAAPLAVFYSDEVKGEAEVSGEHLQQVDAEPRAATDLRSHVAKASKE